ncbi:alpha/beta hydrolase [Flavobacterium sp. ZB4P13]|uniref:alpha/beta hydrolase n=1 Tax=Flavobacterium sp. ZB4P13 TaxID=3401728 RepID=UPI003AACD605
MNFYKLCKKPFFGRFMVEWVNPLSEEEKKEWQQIEVQSKSGGLIAGLFALAKTENAKATIVLGHPMGKEAKGYFIKNGYTNLLRAHGYNVLLFDINGFGESAHGNFSYFDDIIAIGMEAKKLTPDLPIGYHGISLGGIWATIAFADESHNYDFAIVESAATTLDEFWVHFPVAHKTLKILNVFFPSYRKKIRMIDRIKEVKKLQSILFIYSLTDDWTTVSMGERLHLNCNVQSELWTIEKAKHAMIMKSEFKEVYQEKIIAYFDQSINELIEKKSIAK